MRNKAKILLNPKTVFISMILGIALGMYRPDLVVKFQWMGNLYINLLQMCAIVMMPVIVISGIGRLADNTGGENFIRKFIFVYILVMVSVAIISVLIGLAMKNPVTSDKELKKTIGIIMMEEEEMANNLRKEISLDSNLKDVDTKISIIDNIVGFVPSNIFKSFYNANFMQIVIFSIILGMGLTFVDTYKRETLITFFDAIFQVFMNVLNKLMYLLPFGLLSLLASQSKGLNISSIIALSKYLIYTFLVLLITFIISSIIIKHQTQIGYIKQFTYMKEALIIVFASREPLAALPTAIKAMVNDMNLDENKLNITLPIFTGLSLSGFIISFSTAAVFTVYLYGKSMSLQFALVIIFMSIIASMAASGIPAIIGVALLNTILSPISLTGQPMIMVLLFIGPLIEPLFCLVEFYVNCAGAAILSKK